MAAVCAKVIVQYRHVIEHKCGTTPLSKLVVRKKHTGWVLEA